MNKYRWHDIVYHLEAWVARLKYLNIGAFFQAGIITIYRANLYAQTTGIHKKNSDDDIFVDIIVIIRLGVRLFKKTCKLFNEKIYWNLESRRSLLSSSGQTPLNFVFAVQGLGALDGRMYYLWPRSVIAIWRVFYLFHFVIVNS